ncbi:heavy metal-associated isoprenylated plant protein 43-like [Papaver somniferum]|uniref:heavy metal-associated isoprenylated plant protein 43-like n=1 Tax=Papaver somniferum TaxID=3469 RepID=UPI000E6FD16C|nr:heavy metal-associated isoprenylated plant protein 43-like [Papaver somniferum]
MVQRTVLKIDFSCPKCRKKVLKAVTGLQGVDKIEIDAAKSTLTVTGDADPYKIVVRARKSVRAAEIVSIGAPPPPPKPNDGKKPADDKKTGAGGDKKSGGDGVKKADADKKADNKKPNNDGKKLQQKNTSMMVYEGYYPPPPIPQPQPYNMYVQVVDPAYEPVSPCSIM